jgi:uncharacterized membrane protein
VSARALRTTLLLLTLLGLGVAGYLTYLHYSGGAIPCLKGGGCETVQHSTYSRLAGVPVALIGLVGYVAIFASLLAPRGEMTRLATMIFTLMGFGFSAYLTSRELFSIHAICVWCVASAVVMTLLFGLAAWQFLRGDERAGSVYPQAAGSESEPAAPVGAVRP